jgi:hypothetical protein
MAMGQRVDFTLLLTAGRCCPEWQRCPKRQWMLPILVTSVAKKGKKRCQKWYPQKTIKTLVQKTLEKTYTATGGRGPNGRLIIATGQGGRPQAGRRGRGQERTHFLILPARLIPMAFKRSSAASRAAAPLQLCRCVAPIKTRTDFTHPFPPLYLPFTPPSHTPKWAYLACKGPIMLGILNL